MVEVWVPDESTTILYFVTTCRSLKSGLWTGTFHQTSGSDELEGKSAQKKKSAQ